MGNEANTGHARPAAIVKQGSLRPFKRAAALFTAVIETRAKYQDNLFELQQELAKFPPYVSRGHGWKGRIKNRTIEGHWNQDRSKYQPHVGKKELAKAAYRALPMSLRAPVSRISQQVYDELSNEAMAEPMSLEREANLNELIDAMGGTEGAR